MNKVIKLTLNIIVTLACVIAVGFLGYALTHQYKFFLEVTFYNAKKEIYSYLDYYLNFIVES